MMFREPLSADSRIARIRAAGRSTTPRPVLCVAPREITLALRVLIDCGLKATLAPGPIARAILLSPLPATQW
jgi:hypothetical protein